MVLPWRHVWTARLTLRAAMKFARRGDNRLIDNATGVRPKPGGGHLGGGAYEAWLAIGMASVDAAFDGGGARPNRWWCQAKSVSVPGQSCGGAIVVSWSLPS